MSNQPPTPPSGADRPTEPPEPHEAGAPTVISQNKPGGGLQHPRQRLASLAEGDEDTALSKRPQADEDDTAISQKQVLAGRYEIRRELARGGMGRVLVAYDRRLGREIAVKEMLDSDQDARDRFEREVLITARLQHPSIVTIHEAGLGPTGQPFYVMPQVPGHSLHDAIDATPKLADRLNLLPQVIAVCEALAYAHENGVIHRDLKPANVLVGAFGETVVIDWGLAKVMGQAEEATLPRAVPSGPLDHASSLTVVGQVMGTPGYMSPEQAMGAPLDARCDVYALGAILWHLLIGAPPHDGSDIRSVLAAVVAGPPPEPNWTGVPSDLVAIVHRAIAYDPAQRYPSAQALVTDLRRFQSGQLVGAHRYSRLELAARWVNRYRALLGVAGVALLALLAVGAVSLARVLESRRVAEQERAAATQARDEAQRLQHQAQLDRQRSLLQQARVQVGSDPTEALVQLRQLDPALPGWDEARMLAQEARAAGVARWELTAPDTTVVGKLRDGRRLALGSRSGAIHLWDSRDGSSRLLGNQGQRIVDFTNSDDGATLLSMADDGSVWLWELASGSHRVISGPAEAGWLAFFLGDGAVAVVRAAGAVELRDPASGQVLRQVTDSQRRVLRPDAHALLVRRGDQAEVYTGAGEPRRFKLTPEWGFASLSADARQVLASSLGHGLALFDVETGRPKLLGGLGSPAPDEHAVLGSGTVVALLDGRNLAVWRPGATAPSRDHTDCEARDVGSLLGELLVVYCQDGLELMDLGRGTRRVVRTGDRTSPQVGLGGQLATIQQGPVLRVWDLAADLPSEVNLPVPAEDIVAAPDGRRAMAFGTGDRPSIDEVTLPRGPVRSLARLPSAMRARASSPQATTVAWTREGSDELVWQSVATGVTHRVVAPGVTKLQFTPDGAALVAFTARGLTLYAAEGGELGHVETGGEPAFVAVAPDRAWLAVSDRESRQLTIWSRAGQALRRLGVAEDMLALTEDGRWLLSGHRTGDLTVWDTRDWSARGLHISPQGIYGLTALPDGSAAVVVDGEARLWLCPLSGQPARELARLPRMPTYLGSSRDSRRLATFDEQGTVWLVALDSGASWRLHDPRGAFDDLYSAGGSWLSLRRTQLRLWADDLPAQPAQLLPVLQALPRTAQLQP